jgi:hypothetical protein
MQVESADFQFMRKCEFPQRRLCDIDLARIFNWLKVLWTETASYNFLAKIIINSTLFCKWHLIISSEKVFTILTAVLDVLQEFMNLFFPPLERSIFVL